MPVYLVGESSVKNFNNRGMQALISDVEDVLNDAGHDSSLTYEFGRFKTISGNTETISFDHSMVQWAICERYSVLWFGGTFATIA